MKNVLKTSKWVRWTAAVAFGLMLMLNVMVGLEFKKGAMLPTLTLNELNSQSIAYGESASGKTVYEPINWSQCCSKYGDGNCVNFQPCP